MTYLEHHWLHTTEIQIPKEWITSWIIFLPKPNKKPDHPSNLRPISLLHPISKAITRLLANKARQHALPQLSRMPQYAYIPNRGPETHSYVRSNTAVKYVPLPLPMITTHFKDTSTLTKFHPFKVDSNYPLTSPKHLTGFPDQNSYVVFNHLAYLTTSLAPSKPF